jgi:hypothetical protein
MPFEEYVQCARLYYCLYFFHSIPLNPCFITWHGYPHTNVQVSALHENCTIHGYYTASSGNFLPMFWDNLSVPSSGVKKSFGFLTPEGNYHYSSHNNPQECSYHPLHGGSLKSHRVPYMFTVTLKYKWGLKNWCSVLWESEYMRMLF